MLVEAIALLAPSLLALGWYDRLRHGHPRPRQLLFAYAAFVIGINGLLYTITLYLFGHESVVFTDRFAVKYLLAAVALAVVFPLLISLLRSSVSVRVLHND